MSIETPEEQKMKDVSSSIVSEFVDLQKNNPTQRNVLLAIPIEEDFTT
ncbi:2697_t:CDS:2, partial [Ambispora leptoticha]